MAPVSSRPSSIRTGLRGGTFAVLLLCCACAPAPRARTAEPPQRGLVCTLVDSDAGLDDFRALVALARSRPISGVLVTEGIATPTRGASALRRLLAEAVGSARIVPGAAAASPPAWDWLPEVRRNAERLNGLLAETDAAPARARALEDTVAEWVQGCTEVRALVLGPWTSFVRYRPRLGPRLTRVIAQGLPFHDGPGQQRFNCGYDLPACIAVTRAHASGVTWVDLPRGVAQPYAPTKQLIEALPLSGHAGLLRRLLLANEHSWTGALMWDEAAVLYLLRPDDFALARDHQEPRVTPEVLRQRWLEAVTGRSR